jgi:hypothetical protein
MQDELEARTQARRIVSDSLEGPAAVPPRRPLPWYLRNEKFVRAMSMIGIYVFGAIFLVSILALGVFTLISLVFAILFLASIVTVLALWARIRLRR